MIKRLIKRLVRTVRRWFGIYGTGRGSANIADNLGMVIDSMSVADKATSGLEHTGLVYSQPYNGSWSGSVMVSGWTNAWAEPRGTGKWAQYRKIDGTWVDAPDPFEEYCRWCGETMKEHPRGVCVHCSGPPLDWDVSRAVE
jgi:hypothetical protein